MDSNFPERSGIPIFIYTKNMDSASCIVLKEISNGSGSLVTPQNLMSCLFPLKKQETFNTETTQDQLNNLRKYIGFNISEISNMLLVKRPTIYEWLESNNEPSQKNQARLNIIYNLFKNHFYQQSPKIKNFLYKKTYNEESLFSLLTKEYIDEPLIKKIALNIQESLLMQQQKRTERENLLAREGFTLVSQKHKQKVLTRLINKKI